MARQKYTITYKTVGSLKIELDLYLPEKKLYDKTPVLVWYHGGGLLQGNRGVVQPHSFSVLEHGYALISADYRLAPQVTVREILTDILDGLHFIRDDLQQHIPAESGIVLDPTRICVSGSSAGGYITFLAGLYSDVPRVLLPIYPMVDAHGNFFLNRQPKGVREGYVDRSTVAPFLDKGAEVVINNDPDDPRQKMYSFMLQEAILQELWNVTAEDEDLRIPRAIKKKGSWKLPTYVVHGDADVRVGVDQADEVVAALRSVGANVIYERPEGLDHLFDVDPKYKMEEMYAFMYKYMA